MMSQWHRVYSAIVNEASFGGNLKIFKILHIHTMVYSLTTDSKLSRVEFRARHPMLKPEDMRGEITPRDF